MLWAADLHLHSRYSAKVSPAMTLENIAWWAQRKGVDLLGTGDCLQPQWLAEIEQHTVDAEPGLRQLKPEFEKGIHARLPEGMRRSLRFVLSTEVNCAPPRTDPMEGLHQLLYFPSIAVVREFAARAGRLGDLQEGRPTLAISARQLLRETGGFDRVYQAPAHVMNPWFSALGVIGGGLSLDLVYRDELPRLLAVETGLTSDPRMCRRVPSLDRFGLFSCSDAHSLDNIGRECTLLDIEPAYDAVMTALQAGTGDQMKGTLKYPFEFTRYYLNWCGSCKVSDSGKICPRCGKALTVGSRDRLPKLDAVRSDPVWPGNPPPFEALAPLAYVIGAAKAKSHESVGVRKEVEKILAQLGRHERYVLTEAGTEELVDAAGPDIAGAILRQRTGKVSRGTGPQSLGQGGFGF